MKRSVLTNIIMHWRACLISETEYRLALLYAVRGMDGDLIDRAIRRAKVLRELLG